MDSLHLYRHFQDLPESVSRFFNDAGRASDFSLTPAWFQHLAETTREENQDLRIYCLQSDAVPRLLLPMYATITRRWPWQSRQLSSLTNYYSALTGPIGAGNAIAATIQAIAREQPRWDMIDLHPLPLENNALSDLNGAFRAAGMAVQTYFCFGNWYLEVAGRSYQTYFASLPSKLRNTITRKSQQLNAAGRLRIDIISGGPDLEQGIDSYLAIYQASWKKPEPFPDFIPGLIRLCAQQGSLRLGIACIDGIAAAAQIWIIHNGVASIYKLAYDERFSAFSVGSVLTGKLMQQVIDVDRVREVDYLMGDDAYKQDWMSHRRERWGLRAFNLRTPLGVLGAFRHLGIKVLRQLLKNIFQHFPRGKKTPDASLLHGHIVPYNKSKN